MELELRFVDPDLAMPYWDSVLDQRIPVPKQSVLWSDELMGGAKPGDLTEGAFKGWLLENVSYVLKLTSNFKIESLQMFKDLLSFWRCRPLRALRICP